MPFLSYNTQMGIFCQMASVVVCKVTELCHIYQGIRELFDFILRFASN